MDLGQVHSVRTPRALGWRKGLLTFRSGEMETTRVRPLLEMKLFTTRSVCHVGEEKMLSLVWWLFDLKKKRRHFLCLSIFSFSLKLDLLRSQLFKTCFIHLHKISKKKLTEFVSKCCIDLALSQVESLFCLTACNHMAHGVCMHTVVKPPICVWYVRGLLCLLRVLCVVWELWYIFSCGDSFQL